MNKLILFILLIHSGLISYAVSGSPCLVKDTARTKEAFLKELLKPENNTLLKEHMRNVDILLKNKNKQALVGFQDFSNLVKSSSVYTKEDLNKIGVFNIHNGFKYTNGSIGYVEQSLKKDYKYLVYLGVVYAALTCGNPVKIFLDKNTRTEIILDTVRHKVVIYDTIEHRVYSENYSEKNKHTEHDDCDCNRGMKTSNYNTNCVLGSESALTSGWASWVNCEQTPRNCYGAAQTSNYGINQNCGCCCHESYNPCNTCQCNCPVPQNSRSVFVNVQIQGFVQPVQRYFFVPQQAPSRYYGTPVYTGGPVTPSHNPTVGGPVTPSHGNTRGPVTPSHNPTVGGPVTPSHRGR